MKITDISGKPFSLYTNTAIVTISGIISGILYLLLKNNLIEIPVSGNTTDTVFKKLATVSLSVLSIKEIIFWPLVFVLFYVAAWFIFGLICKYILKQPLVETLKHDSYTYLLAFTVPFILIFRFNVNPPTQLHLITGLYLLMIFFKFRRVFKKMFKKASSVETSGLFTMIFLVLFLINMELTTRCITGDEPHYLIMTHSLIHDGDLNLANNYANKDYFNFFKYSIDPHTTTNIYDGRKLAYSIHEPGLSFVLLPGYLLAGVFGAVITMNIFAALITVNLFLLFLGIGVPRDKSLKLSVLLSFIAPVSLYAQQLFPEILAALIILYSFRKINEGPGDNPLNYARIIIPMAAILWLNVRYIPVFTGLFIYLVFRSKHKFINWLTIILPLVISYAGLRGYMLNYYGNPSFAATKGYGSNVFSWIRVDLLLNNSMKFLFDREIGLFIYAPVLMLFLLGTAMLLRKYSRTAIFALMIVISEYVLITVNGLGGNGGWAPPARYMVCITPLLSVMAGYAYSECKSKPFQKYWDILLAYSLIVSAIMLSNPVLQYNQLKGNNIMVKKLLGESASNIFNYIIPTFFNTSVYNIISATILLIAVLALNIWLYKKELNKNHINC